MYKVLVTSRMFGKINNEPLKRLESAHCQIIYSPYLGMTHREDQMLEIVPDIDALIIGADRITSRVIEKANCLKVIAVHGVGVDQIDVAAATTRGILVTNVPGCNTQAVADFTIGLMLSASRSIPKADHSTKKGKWESLLGTGLYQKILGIVGLGNIGKAVAKRALGFQMRILAFDIQEDFAFAQGYGVQYVPLDEVLRTADFISVHLPLTQETKGLLNRKNLSLMKKSAYLINCSRGNIVDESALYDMLLSKSIRGAALDVYSEEPPSNLDWLNLPNVITTPHMAAFTYEAIEEASNVSAENIARVLSGRQPLNPVNVEASRSL